MPSDINETIAEVLRLDAKATPGPWVRTRTGATMAVAGCGGSRGGVYTLAESAYPSMSADLIAYYRTAAPALAREVQRLQAEIQPRIERSIAFQDAMEEAEAERDEARAEVERLKAEVERLALCRAVLQALEAGEVQR